MVELSFYSKHECVRQKFVAAYNAPTIVFPDYRLAFQRDPGVLTAKIPREVRVIWVDTKEYERHPLQQQFLCFDLMLPVQWASVLLTS